MQVVNAKMETANSGTENISGDFNVDYSSGHSPFLLETNEICQMRFLLKVENNTSTDKQWRIKRFIESGSNTDWVVYLSYETSCMSTTTINPYCSPLPIPLNTPAGESDDIQVQIYIPSFGFGKYKFYLGDCDNQEDSIEIYINSSIDASLNNVNKTSTFSMFPNPSNDKISINVDNNEQGNLKIVDIIGNVVFEEEINSTSEINVSDFKNGIYFVSIETNGVLTQLEKLIVKH